MSDAVQRTAGVKALATDGRGLVVAYDPRRASPEALVGAVGRLGYHAKVH